MPATTAWSVGLALAAVAAVAVVAVFRAASGADTTTVPAAAGVAVAVVGIILGIPHGAVDHVVAVRLATPAPRGPGAVLGVVLASYLLVAAVAATALLVVPDASVAVFLLVAAAHFAWGEVTFATERRGRRLTSPGGAVLATTALGVVLVGLPLATVEGRAALAPLAPGLAAVLDGVIGRLPGPLLTIPPGGVTLPAALLAAGAAGGLALAAAAWRRRLHREAAEVLTLLLLFLATPPLIAFGVYFGAWHALRHTRRLVDLLAPGGDRRTQAVAFARAAAVPTAGAMGVLVLLWTLRADADVVITGISLLLALTFPHVLVVAALDRGRARRGVAPPDGTRADDALPGLGAGGSMDHTRAPCPIRVPPTGTSSPSSP